MLPIAAGDRSQQRSLGSGCSPLAPSLVLFVLWERGSARVTGGPGAPQVLRIRSYAVGTLTATAF